MVDASHSGLGLIAGDGLLPFEVARTGRQEGRKVSAVGFHGTTHDHQAQAPGARLAGS